MTGSYVTLTDDEARAVVELIDQLSGGNADRVLANVVTPKTPLQIAAVKLFTTGGFAHYVPYHLRGI